jgi:hypothetical protein
MNASFRKPRHQDRSIGRTLEGARLIIEPGNECAWQIERSLPQAATLETESNDRRSIGQKYMAVSSDRFSDEKIPLRAGGVRRREPVLSSLLVMLELLSLA